MTTCYGLPKIRFLCKSADLLFSRHFLRGIRKVDQSKPENKTFPESRKNTFIRWPHAMGFQKSDFYANRPTSYFRAIFTWYKEGRPVQTGK